jgi:hypothetical protein
MPTAVFNPALQTSAKIKFLNFPDVEFTTQSFQFPAIRAIYPMQPYPGQSIPMAPVTVEYDPLTVNFLVDANLTNYISIVQWIQNSLTMPSANVFSDASVVFLDNLKQPVTYAAITDCMPVSITPLDYTVAVQDPQPLVATATFRYTNYNFE